jgi:hypothetical protein
MRSSSALALAGVLLVAGLAPAFAAAPATPSGDRDAYYRACVKVSPGLAKACGCRADFAMKLQSQELRTDIILSMANPNAYAAKARAGKVSADIIHGWEQFSADSAKQCGIDN